MSVEGSLPDLSSFLASPLKSVGSGFPSSICSISSVYSSSLQLATRLTVVVVMERVTWALVYNHNQGVLTDSTPITCSPPIPIYFSRVFGCVYFLPDGWNSLPASTRPEGAPPYWPSRCPMFNVWPATASDACVIVCKLGLLRLFIWDPGTSRQPKQPPCGGIGYFCITETMVI